MAFWQTVMALKVKLFVASEYCPFPPMGFYAIPIASTGKKGLVWILLAIKSVTMFTTW